MLVVSMIFLRTRKGNEMQITLASILWSILAIFSLIGLYYFNRRMGIFNFITERKFLVLLIIASLLGMRSFNLLGSLIVGITVMWMLVDYKPYVDKCKRLKQFQQPKHH